MRQRIHTTRHVQDLLSDLYYMYAGVKKRVRSMDEYHHVKAAGYQFC